MIAQLRSVGYEVHVLRYTMLQQTTLDEELSPSSCFYL